MKRHMKTANAKGAFMQGEQLDREVSIEPTQELIQEYGLRPGEVSLLAKAVYDLADAPRERFRASSSCSWTRAGKLFRRSHAIKVS